MRLKFLFFPIILIVSVSISIGYILPEIGNVRDINVKKLENTQVLQAIKDKQSAIESIGAQIMSNSEGKIAVSNYLPDKKVEERIIAGVNYLAVDSSVSLVDISLENANKAVLTDGLAATVNDPVATPVGSPSLPSENVLTANDGMRFTTVKISISGSYEKIKLFVGQLQKIYLFNNIKSLSISSQKKNAANMNATAGDSSNSTDLLADIVIDFGYLPSSKIDNNKIARFNPWMDSDTINTLKQYISQKTESTSAIFNNTGSKGKENPFLP